MQANQSQLLELDPSQGMWEKIYTVHPLVVIGTRDEDSGTDLAPKHLAMPLSWQNHYGFVCAPTHRTYQNVKRTREFTVTFVRPSQAVVTALSATPRQEDGSKPIINALTTFSANTINCDFLQDGYLFLECVLEQMIDNLGNNVLIIGRIAAARVASDALRQADEDDQQLISRSPLLAYLYPDRFAEILASNQLPFPVGFKR